MDDHLKILIVDDNPDDRALARREIDREFPNCQFWQAITAKELTQAVESTDRKSTRLNSSHIFPYTTLFRSEDDPNDVLLMQRAPTQPNPHRESWTTI